MTKVRTSKISLSYHFINRDDINDVNKKIIDWKDVDKKLCKHLLHRDVDDVNSIVYRYFFMLIRYLVHIVHIAMSTISTMLTGYYIDVNDVDAISCKHRSYHDVDDVNRIVHRFERFDPISFIFILTLHLRRIDFRVSFWIYAPTDYSKLPGKVNLQKRGTTLFGKSNLSIKVDKYSEYS